MTGTTAADDEEAAETPPDAADALDADDALDTDDEALADTLAADDAVDDDAAVKDLASRLVESGVPVGETVGAGLGGRQAARCQAAVDGDRPSRTSQPRNLIMSTVSVYPGAGAELP